MLRDSELLSLGKKIALVGGKQALKYFRQNFVKFNNKSHGGFDPVSIADKSAERVMRGMIKKNRPQDGIIGEEFGILKGNSGLTWVLDPIDGTRAFMAGQTSWTVLLSLNEGDQQHFGIIYQPFTDEMFVGNNDCSEVITQKKTKPLGVRKCKLLSDAILHTTDPQMGSKEENHATSILGTKCALSRYSLDAYAYGLMAAGCIDLIIESSMKFYDIQAPIAVVKSAGGIVSDWVGGCDYNGGRIIACGDKRIHEEALSLLATLMN